MISFISISQYKPGDLFDIIRRSYGRLIEEDPVRWKPEEKKWEDFDRNAFATAEIGKCIFVTRQDGKSAGLASYDPRNFPECGIIGQNCVLPEFRGQGLGVSQIEELLRIFRRNKVKKAKVTTHEHPFFESAQKMYRSVGFKEVARRVGGPDPKYKLIDFEMEL